jgi:hypothetical protein
VEVTRRDSTTAVNGDGWAVGVHPIFFIGISSDKYLLIPHVFIVPAVSRAQLGVQHLVRVVWNIRRCTLKRSGTEGKLVLAAYKSIARLLAASRQLTGVIQLPPVYIGLHVPDLCLLQRVAVIHGYINVHPSCSIDKSAIGS